MGQEFNIGKAADLVGKFTLSIESVQPMNAWVTSGHRNIKALKKRFQLFMPFWQSKNYGYNKKISGC